MKIRRTVAVLLAFVLPGLIIPAFSQPAQLNGIVRDELTRKPIRDVNIRIYGSNRGTATDPSGRFSLRIAKMPVTLVFSCIGYEEATFNIMAAPKSDCEFSLRPKIYSLEAVDISEKKYSFLFRDKAYSVLDYELMNGRILLLVFRNNLKRSELVVLDRSGDTLAMSRLPESPPASLYKDFLLNVHYFSKAGNAYQCYYPEQDHRLQFVSGTTVDSLLSCLRTFIFRMAGRLYFQEIKANGFGTAFGFFAKDSGKTYIRRFYDEKKIAEYVDDLKFYNYWNAGQGAWDALAGDGIGSTTEFDFESSRNESRVFGLNEMQAHKMLYFNMTFPVIKEDESTIAFFNYGSDRIELMDPNGKVIRTVPIVFHKDTRSGAGHDGSPDDGWRWGGKILWDESNRRVYTLFRRNGMVKIRKIDTETGRLSEGTILPFLFPEKIEIFNGEAFFLVKSDGLNSNRKLVKCKLE